MEKNIPCKWKQKKGGVAIFISDKIDFKKNLTITRDKVDHCLVLKDLIQREDITLVNIYASNIGAPKYMRKIVVGIK